MSLKVINPELGDVSFQRYGETHGMLAFGIVETGCNIEVLEGQEVELKRGEEIDLVQGLKFGGGIVNGKEIHAVIPVSEGNIHLLYQSDIRGGYVGEPIIGS